MRYVLLIYHSEQDAMNWTPEQGQQIMDEYWGYENEIGQAGVKLAGEGLHPTNTATSVRVRNDEVLTSDGPFAETKEQLGGFYLINAENLDEAIAWAAKIPDAKNGTIEIRPVMEFEPSQQ